MSTSKKLGDTSSNFNMATKEYKYTQEISQMVFFLKKSLYKYMCLLSSLQMFVFGEVQEPIPETVNLVEDIVRSQLIELVRLDVAD